MNVKGVLLSGVGFLLLGMGAIGLLLPIWPTTPFILAAAGCFAYNPKLQSRIMKIPFFREYIQNYKDKKGLSAKTVTINLSSLWIMLLISALTVRIAWLTGLFALIGVCVTIHILWIARERNR